MVGWAVLGALGALGALGVHEAVAVAVPGAPWAHEAP